MKMAKNFPLSIMYNLKSFKIIFVIGNQKNSLTDHTDEHRFMIKKYVRGFFYKNKEFTIICVNLRHL